MSELRDPVAIKRYQDKLKLVGLHENEDSFANVQLFTDDMRLWPPVESRDGHIFCYFIQRPGVYTQAELMQWKSMDPYNYFRSGHVHEVKVWNLSSCCILLARVNPSQSSPNNAWIAVKTDGNIITAHCTCMAG